MLCICEDIHLWMSKAKKKPPHLDNFLELSRCHLIFQKALPRGEKTRVKTKIRPALAQLCLDPALLHCFPFSLGDSLRTPGIRVLLALFLASTLPSLDSSCLWPHFSIWRPTGELFLVGCPGTSSKFETWGCIENPSLLATPQWLPSLRVCSFLCGIPGHVLVGD